MSAACDPGRAGALLLCALAAAAARADDPCAAEPSAPASGQPFAVHGQATYTVQADDGFHSPSEGANSLTPSQSRETIDASVFLGARLAPGVEGWIEPEVDQGFGLNSSLGMAGFPSGVAY